MADEVRKSSLLGHCTVVAIPNGVDTENFQPRDRRAAREKAGVPAEAKIVLFLADSAAEKRKGLSVLLEALKGLDDDEGIYLMVLGRGLADYNLGSRAKTVDFVEDEASLSFVYSAADVFVIPSLQDNLPNTAIEALACGIPTVGSDAGGIPEIVRDGETGLVVPAGDALRLKEAIRGLLGDAGRRAAMSERARRVAVEEYSLEVQARRYMDLYNEMVSTARPLE
jgi:glycosyltransferase involved in cell wall biosynthesis